ncbi:unnamed protein product, partial [Prorocentrum cordatum]
AETSGRLSSAASVLVAWRAGKDRAPTPPDLLRPVVQALVDQEPDALVAEVCDHLRAHKAVLCNSRNAREILDVVARAGNTAAMATLWKTFNTTFQIPPTSSVYEVLSGGYASVGAEDKVGEVAAEMKRNRMKPTARGLSLTIKGYLKSGMIYPVMNQIVEMKKLGFHVPPYALAQFFRISCEAGRLQEVFEAATAAGLQAPSEAVVLMLEHCAHKNHTDLALRIESAAREAKTPLLVGAFDALLKLHSLSGDLRAIDLFEEMKASGCSISEGLCVGLLARCAESKFLRFADLIVKHVRANATMTIALYSALMKVYAYCGMYDKACDLYDQLREDGLEPDSMMYGCLMKFAVECGRTDLSRDLSEKDAAVIDACPTFATQKSAGGAKGAMALAAGHGHRGAPQSVEASLQSMEARLQTSLQAAVATASASMPQAFQDTVIDLAKQSDARFLAMEDRIAPAEARMDDLDRMQKDIQMLTDELVVLTSGVSVPQTGGSWDRDPDPAVVTVFAKPTLPKQAVEQALAPLVAEAQLHDHVRLEGDAVSQSLLLRCKGAGALAERRAGTPLQLMRLGPGQWREVRATAPTGAQVNLNLGEDRNRRRIRQGIERMLPRKLFMEKDAAALSPQWA